MTARSRIAGLALATSGRLARAPRCDDIPAGRIVELPGRGSTYLVDTGPPPAAAHRWPGDAAPAPTVVLLHALACTGLLTWYPSIAALRSRYRVVTFDQRWHGQGICSPSFSLDDCADDAVAVADLLGLDRVLLAGYSMGSLVAQLAWRRHPDRVLGAVLCASTTRFVQSGRDPRVLRAVAERTRRAAAGSLAARQATVWEPGADVNRWALAQFRSSTGRRVAAAAAQISTFDSSGWITEMDVPAAVVVTARDRLIPAERQRRLARMLPDATVYEVDSGHAGCVLAADRFTPALRAACASVAVRASARARL